MCTPQSQNNFSSCCCCCFICTWLLQAFLPKHINDYRAQILCHHRHHHHHNVVWSLFGQIYICTRQTRAYTQAIAFFFLFSLQRLILSASFYACFFFSSFHCYYSLFRWVSSGILQTIVLDVIDHFLFTHGYAGMSDAAYRKLCWCCCNDVNRFLACSTLFVCHWHDVLAEETKLHTWITCNSTATTQCMLQGLVYTLYGGDLSVCHSNITIVYIRILKCWINFTFRSFIAIFSIRIFFFG